jgi:hypothetical protein
MSSMLIIYYIIYIYIINILDIVVFDVYIPLYPFSEKHNEDDAP